MSVADPWESLERWALSLDSSSQDQNYLREDAAKRLCVDYRRGDHTTNCRLQEDLQYGQSEAIL